MQENINTFEGAIKRLEAIAALMENGNSTLEESLSLYEEGTILVSGLNEKIKNAELKILEIKEAGKDK